MSGYVVTRPFSDSGVGSNFGSLVGALWFAQTLGRTLVVDWRGQPQMLDPDTNYFSEFFRTPGELLGVRVLYAPAEEAGDYGPESEAAWLSPDEAAAVAAGRAPSPGAPIVLQPFHGLARLHPGPEAVRFKLERTIYRSLRLAPEIEAAADAWWDEHLGGAFVVGVNVRTGNGAHFGKGMPYASRVDISLFDDRDRFRRVIDRGCRARLAGLPPAVREGYQVFFATDSGSMAELLATLSNAVQRRQVYPPPGTGDEHAFSPDGYTDRDGIVDSLTDMFLLARCDALVYNSSMFNHYARVVTGHFGGNEAHLETLFPSVRAKKLAARVASRIR